MKKILQASMDSFDHCVDISAKEGKPFIMPTDTIYGLCAPISSIEANREIYRIKKRSPDIPFPLLIGSYEQLHSLVDQTLSEEMKSFVEYAWQHPTTVVFRANGGVDPLFTYNNTIALRMVKNGWLKDALKISPISATSANISSCDYVDDFFTIFKIFDIELFLFDKRRTNTQPSTIVDISTGAIKLLR